MPIAELLDKRAFEEAKLHKLKVKAAKNSALSAPDNPLDWVLAIYRDIFSRPMGEFHKQMLEWGWGIEPGVRSAPLVSILSRGFGKSTLCETITVMLGAREKRKYVLYVSETQELADSHLLAIRSMIESPILASYYPTFSAPKVSKEGHSRGWRRNRLYCGNNFVIDAIGLDTAKRGTRIMSSRPDFFVFDDIDAKGDSPAITQKKIDTITTSLLPAGSPDAIALFVQNMIIDTGVFAQLAQSTPPFLKNRILSGPFPALQNFSWSTDAAGKIVIDGEPTWAGFDLGKCREIVDEIGLTAFRSEFQHEYIDEGSLFAGITFKRINQKDLPPLWRKVIAIDPSVSETDRSDSNGICVAGIDDEGKIYILDSWEKRATPEFTLRKALYFAIKYNCDLVRCEGNQGDFLWQTLWESIVEESGLSDDRIPGFEIVKATGATGGKLERAALMLVDYELGKIFHVINQQNTYLDLEAALLRLGVKKPYDLADATFWGWSELRGASNWLM
jgi:hypothetical protein